MKIQTFLRHPVACAAALVLASASARAETYSWLQTSGGPYNWTDTFNWDPSTAYPFAAGDVANITTDITAAHTIRLRAPISLGTLNVGDGAGSGNNFSFIIANLTGESFALTFDSGDAEVPAKLNLASTGTPTTTISAPVVLNTPLEINVGGTDATNGQRVNFTGALNTQDNPITIVGGFFSSALGVQTTISGPLIGTAAATITNNSLSPLVIAGNQTQFLGKIIVNNRATGSNQAGLTISHTGSVAAVGEIEINGYLSGGVTQNGGTVQVGQGSSVPENPGQRLTQNTITFNGGTLIAGGQPLVAGVEDRLIKDVVDTVNFNSGYSLLTLTSSLNTGTARLLDVDTVLRSAGATVFVRAARFASPEAADATTLRIGNSAAYLKGNGDTSGTTMSIIPWMTVANANTSAQSSDSFATYTDDGVRGLVTTGGEYATLLTAGAEHNVSVASAAIGGANTSLTVNSLRYSSAVTTNIGEGKTLAVASGGLIFVTNGGSIGATGDAAAGTLQFGTDENPAEGVIWSRADTNGTTGVITINVNTIGASITGAAGLSKAGAGTVVLTGTDNAYSGLTYVGGGMLQVGNGNNLSTLGFSNEVAVASGATLSLVGGNMIQDTATLRLEQFGLFNGKVTLFPEVNDTIGALWLGDQMMAAGTYGAVGSQADFENDTWFSGTGLLTVVPEPGSAALLLGGIAMLVGCRRRK